MKPLALLFCLALAACSTTATMVPTAGPLTKAGSPEIKATISGISSYSGKLSFTMPDGEAVAGHWQSSRTGRRTRQGAGTARGDRGSVFDIEFESDSLARGIGKATDNRGNAYRIMIRGI
jgi:hypothetical protein